MTHQHMLFIPFGDTHEMASPAPTSHSQPATKHQNVPITAEISDFPCITPENSLPLHPIPTLEGVCPEKSVTQWFFLG